MKHSSILNLLTAVLFLSLVSCSTGRASDENPTTGEDTPTEQTTDTEEVATSNTENDKYDPNTVNDELAKKIGEYLVNSAEYDDLDEKYRSFQMYEIDLNNDGKNEVFVNFFNMYFCGSGGCTVLLLNSDMTLNTRFTVMNTPIYIEKAEGNNWAVLKNYNYGKMRELKYTNGKYPSNPSVAPATAEPSADAITILGEENREDRKFYTF